MDATLTILRTPEAYSFYWLPHATGFDRQITPVCLTGVTPIVPEIHTTLQAALGEAAQFLNLPNQPSHSAAATAASFTPLVNLGQALFTQTIPPGIQSAITHLPSQAHINLVTDDVDLPWELLHDGQEFLALRHQIGRVLPQSEWPRQSPAPVHTPLRCLLLGDPMRDLPGAAAEIDALTDLLDERRDLVQSESLAGSSVTKMQLLQALASGNYDLIHFAGHARPGELQLADGWLNMHYIQQAVKGQPLLYLNACASARSQIDATLPQAEQVTQNLASAFLRRGAAAVIGMLWPIPDQSSKALSLDFYRGLLRGATVGEALRQSRNLLRTSSDAGVAWLAPLLFGDPRLRPIRAGLIYRPGTVMVVRLPHVMPNGTGRSVDALSTTLQHRLYALRNLVAGYGGVTAVINSAGMIVVFGVYNPVDQDSVAALRAACEIRSSVLTWGLGAPRIGVASGELAAEPLTALGGDDERAALRQPFLIGEPMTEAVALAHNANDGQIYVNTLTARSTQQRYRFAPGALGQLLLHEITALEPTPTPALGQSAPSGGRPRELQRLRDEWAAVRRRQGRVAGVVGEAGIGKSHLLAEFAQTLRAESMQWLPLTCAPDTQHTPYGLLAQLLRRLLQLPAEADEQTATAHIQSRLAGFGGALQRNPAERTALLLDLLGYRPAPLPTQTELHSGQQAVYQSRLLAPLQFLVGQTVQQQPLLLVVEDAHWLDDASQQVLAHLTDNLRAQPLLLLLSYRPGWEHRWFGKPYYYHLPLDELELDASRQLLEHYLQSSQLPKELLELPERLGGNPLFLIETVHSLQERGILQQQPAIGDAPARWVLQQSLTYLQLPDSVQRMIQLRFGQLGEETRRILEIAAIIGLRFAPTLLAEIAELTEFALWPHLEQLQNREFIAQDWSSDTYLFRHAAIQEAAYAEVAMNERRVWHARIAQALEQSSDFESLSPDLLAQHYYRSLVSTEAEPDEPLLMDDADPRLFHHALTYLLQSGERALARYALQEAKQAFRRGQAVAALLSNQVDPHYTLRAQVQAGLGSTYDILGERALALHHLRQAYALFHAQPLSAESRRFTGDLARRIARLYAWRKEYTTAFAWIAMGLEKVAQQADPADQAVTALLHIHAGSIYYNQSDYDATVRSCQTGMALAQAIQAEAALAEGYHLLGAVAQLRSQYEEALQHYADALAIRQRHEDVYQIARVTGNIGVVYYDKTEWDQARAHHARARSFWQEIGDRDMLAHTSPNLGNVELCLGNWEPAQHYFAEALAVWSDLESQRWIDLCHNNLGLLAIEQTDWATARQHLQPNLASPFQDIRLEAHYALAEVALGERQVAEALTLAEQAPVLAEALGSKREQALALRIAGRAWAAAGEVARGRQQLMQSLELLQETGGRYESARTQYRLAEVEADAQQLPPARALCQAALATFAAVQARKDEERARALLAKLMVDS